MDKSKMEKMEDTYADTSEDTSEEEYRSPYVGECDICKISYHVGDFSSVKRCEKCERIICVEKCVGITGCQTTWGICKECFEYKCQKCKSDISRDIVYIVDCDDLLDLCSSCK